MPVGKAGGSAMTKKEKRHFIDSLILSIQQTIHARLDDIPEDWDGNELRLYIRDKFNEQAVWRKPTRATVRKYNEDIRSRALM